jgi:hypothetical protein
LGLALAVLATGAMTGSAQAYVYWSNVGQGFGSGGTTLGRSNLDGGGVTHTFLAGLSNPGGVAVDAGHIYWANSPANSIGRANLDGSGASPNFIPNATDSSDGSAGPAGLATDGSFIYWTDGAHAVDRAPVTGGAVSSHFIDAGPGTDLLGIAVNSSTAFIGNGQQILQASAATGGSPTQLAMLQHANVGAIGLAVNGGFVYFAELNTPAGSIGRV